MGVWGAYKKVINETIVHHIFIDVFIGCFFTGGLQRSAACQ